MGTVREKIINALTLFYQAIKSVFVQKSNVVDNCASTSTSDPLSANQGTNLQGQIDDINSTLDDLQSELTAANYYESASDYYYISGGIGFYKYGKWVMAQAIDCSIKVEPGKTWTTIAYIDDVYRPAVDTVALLGYSGLSCCGLIKFRTNGEMQVQINNNISVKGLYIWFNAVYACY